MICSTTLVLFSGCTSRAARPILATPVQAVVTSPPPTTLPSTMAEAHDVLVNFLTLLHTKKYAEAAAFYGGEYEPLQVFNPQIDPADKAALWTWACDNQLLKCLEVRSATFKKMVGDSFIFQVEFSNPDGSRFILGPCCGANETEMPPVAQFEYTVRPGSNHEYVVMNPPPYVP